MWSSSSCIFIPVHSLSVSSRPFTSIINLISLSLPVEKYILLGFIVTAAFLCYLRHQAHCYSTTVLVSADHPHTIVPALLHLCIVGLLESRRDSPKNNYRQLLDRLSRASISFVGKLGFVGLGSVAVANGRFQNQAKPLIHRTRREGAQSPTSII